MRLSRDQVLAVMREHGDADREAEAERELPQVIDLESDADLLERYGLSKTTIESLGGTRSI